MQAAVTRATGAKAHILCGNTSHPRPFTALPSSRKSIRPALLPEQRSPLPANQAVASSTAGSLTDPSSSFSEVARRAVRRASRAVDRYGWTSFWIQLTLSLVSGIILLFSVAFTSQSGPKASLYFTVFGILAGFFSTFWSFSYTSTAKKLKQLAVATGAEAPPIKKQQVVDLITKGVVISMIGFGSALAGISTLVGGLMVSTLNNTSVLPLTDAASTTTLALDVFLVQAATNTLLGHFLSLCCSLWMLYVLSENPLKSSSSSSSSASSSTPTPAPAAA